MNVDLFHMFAETKIITGGFKAFLALALFSVWSQVSVSREISFARTLYPVFEKAACRSCHNPDGVAIERYEELFRSETDFHEGARIAVETMLQSPHFLFRLDETSDPKLNPYVTASRLSYMLWDSMPDAALFESARRGELSTPQGLEATARRMLEDPRARRSLDEFASQWMRFDRLLTAAKDRRRYPNFNREAAVAMT